MTTCSWFADEHASPIVFLKQRETIAVWTLITTRLQIHLLHGLQVDANELPVLTDCLTNYDLCRPLDCMAVDGKLYIADGGEGEVRSALHVFEIGASCGSTGDEGQNTESVKLC